ncbi:NAD-dependent epimerase/dehydratase family protein [Echinicola marina]|uniref:NAD-dependent epimerase/dehydratase family protein n=1 Tax=Echinicola marina TaxID=2859768 RepID=UPI001CF6936F|nr:NAD-dependent epimerase/dehydratase family protein [Echinicola marina]UCS93236.1 NAD-dependent epimerase/dehydratase family protein [Echinicola marina]
MTRILLTGASGFLGKELKNYFLKEGHNVDTIGRSNCDYNIDLTKRFALKSSLEFDLIIHAAGKAHFVPKTEREKKDFYKVNFEGTKNLCHAIDKLVQKPRSFIFISTVAVYGVESGELIDESHFLLGDSPYAKSKIQAEMYLKKWANERNIILGILRLPLIVGSDAPGNLGMMIKGIKTGKYLSIGKAKSKKSMVWVGDIPTVFQKLSEVGGVYNLTDGYHSSFGELEGSISKAFNKGLPRRIPIWLANILAKVGDVVGNSLPINSSKLKKITSDLTFDDSLARMHLDWKPSKVLNKLKETLNS